MHSFCKIKAVSCFIFCSILNSNSCDEFMKKLLLLLYSIRSNGSCRSYANAVQPTLSSDCTCELSRWSAWCGSCLQISCSSHFVGDEDYSCFRHTTHALTRVEARPMSGFSRSGHGFSSARPGPWLHAITPLCFLWVWNVYGMFLDCVFFFSGF